VLYKHVVVADFKLFKALKNVALTLGVPINQGFDLECKVYF
jgi:hypothetical protein